MTECTDIAGNVVTVGTRVAVAFRQGNQAEIRVGVVTGFSSQRSSSGFPAEQVDQIVVQWEHSSGYGSMAGKTTKIFTANKRFIAVGPLQ